MSRNNGSSKTMIAAERRRRICEAAARRGWVNVNDLADALGVGPDTIRNDLDALHEDGKLVRTHGGAVVKESTEPIPYSQAKHGHIAEKAAIGEAALTYIPMTGHIYIGPGTTTYQLATRMKPGSQVQVYTSSLPIAEYLVTNNIASVNFPGGVILPEALTSDWSMSQDALEDLWWDVSFIGVSGVDAIHGLTEESRSGVERVRRIIQHSKKVIVLCDSFKLDKPAHAVVFPITSMDVLITDWGANPDFVNKVMATGVEVIVAGSLDISVSKTSLDSEVMR